MTRLEQASDCDLTYALQAALRGEEGDDAELGALFLVRALRGLAQMG